MRIDAPTIADFTNATHTHTSNATGGVLVTYVPVETPGGSVNGSNPTFTLAHTPLFYTLTVNRVVQVYSVDFTISGSTITFATDSIPQTGDMLRITYIY